MAADERTTAVKGIFQTEVAMLELLRASLMTDGRVERKEFHEILAPFHAHDASIEAVEWLPRVRDGDREPFEAAAVRDGFDGFQITETDKDGNIVRAAQRDEYFPILYVGPRKYDASILGYDVGSEPVRLECLRLACNSGRAVASGRFTFIQEPANSSGFLVCLPVYEKERPWGTLEERRKNLLGFILGVFRPTDMLDTALAKLQPQGIDVGLFDPSGAHSGQTIDFHTSRLRDDSAPPINLDELRGRYGKRVAVELGVAGHPWTVVCAPTHDFDAGRRTWWPWGVLVSGLAFTGLLSVYLTSSIGRTELLEAKVLEQTEDVRQAQEEVICRLVSASTWSDEETGMHIRRTGLLSAALARAAGWYGGDVESIRQAAPMHDIGKIGIPDAVLKKAGQLTPEETEVMKGHARIGGEILAGSRAPMLQMAREIAINHHERWDGKGYPRGLAGKAIPESARIVAIVDTYDALMHDRVYRPAMKEEEVLDLMRRESGRQFDPRLLADFFRHLGEMREILKRHADEHRPPSSPRGGAQPS